MRLTVCYWEYFQAVKHFRLLAESPVTPAWKAAGKTVEARYRPLHLSIASLIHVDVEKEKTEGPCNPLSSVGALCRLLTQNR